MPVDNNYNNLTMYLTALCEIKKVEKEENKWNTFYLCDT